MPLLLRVIVFYVVCLVGITAQTPAVLSFGQAEIQSSNTRERGTLVTVLNKGSVPITAAVVSMRRFHQDGRLLMDWTRYVDAFITEPKAITQNSSITLDFGRQTISTAPLDELTVRGILFADGTWVGDNFYLKRVLRRRRVVRDALNELLQIGDRLNQRATDLTTAMGMAKEFADEEEQSVSDVDERNAMVTGVGSFADNLRLSFSPGHLVFSKSIRDYYEEWRDKLSQSRPSI